jgi:hypothetical protein
MSIAQGALQEMFVYRDGSLYNRYARSPRSVKGAVAGYINKSSGYWQVGIGSKRYQLSRLIWTYHNGDIPEKMEIDHITRDHLDNRIENLRIVTRAQNEWNKERKGYHFYAGKWRVRMQVNGVLTHIGMFATEAEARAAYLRETEKLRLGFTPECGKTLAMA